MNINFDFKKFEADKIALLGLFALSLLLAHIIASVKTALIFSEPIELSHTGLAISVPIGNGWESEKKWEYQANSFVLNSNFTANTDKPTAWAFCQYILDAEALHPQKWFEEKTAEVSGSILEKGQQQAGALTVDWAHINKPELLLNSFLGTVELPYNRRLNIEVHQITSEADHAETVFRQILDNLNFEDNQLFRTGSEVIETIKNNGIDSFLDNRNRQTCFLIKDSSSQNIGFMIDVLLNSKPDTKFNIHAAGHFYVKDPHEQKYLQEQASRFQCGNNLNEFIWESERKSPAGRNNTEIILNESGLMTVRDTGMHIELRHRLSPVAIPDIFIEALLGRIIESNTKQIMVDLIDADGKITPTLISVTEEDTDDQDTPYVIKLDLLDGEGFSQLIFLNDHRQITRVIVQRNKRYVLEAATRADIVREFPERADFLTQKSNIFQDNVF
jgi:hypothetical protein